MKPTTLPRRIPLLIVRDAADAADFYLRVFAAMGIARFTDGAQGSLSNAALSLGDAR